MEKMSKQTILLEFDRWDCDKLSLFLTENGLSDCCEIIKKMKITGREFLELTEMKLLAWRNFSPKFRKNALINFIEDVKKNPEKYVKKSSIPRRTVSSEKTNDLATELKHLEASRKNGRTDIAASNKRSPKNIERSPKNVGVRKISADNNRPKIGSRDSSKSPSNSKININSRSPNRFNKDGMDTNFCNRKPNKINTNVSKGSDTNKISPNTNNRAKNNAKMQSKTQIKYNQKSKHTTSDESEEEIKSTRANKLPGQHHLNKSSQNTNNRSKNNARIQTKTQIRYNQRSRQTSDETEEEIECTWTNQLPDQHHLIKSNHNTNNGIKNSASYISYNQRSSSDEWEEETVGTRSNQSPLNKPSQNINNTKNDNARMQTKTQIKYNQNSRQTSSDESEEEIADTGTKLPEKCPLNKLFLHNINSALEGLFKKQPPSILQKSELQIPANLLSKDAMKSQIQSRKNNSNDTEDDEEVEEISDDEEFYEPIYENSSHKNNTESDEDEEPIYEDVSRKQNERYPNVSSTNLSHKSNTESDENEEPIYEDASWNQNERYPNVSSTNLSHKNNTESDEDEEPIYEDASWKENKHYQNVPSPPPLLPAKLQNFDTNTRKNEKINQDAKNSNADDGLPITNKKKIFTWGKRNKNETPSAKLINKSEKRLSVNEETETDGCFTIFNPFSGRKSSLPIINNQTKKLPEPPTSIPKLNLSTFGSETSLSSGFSEESSNQASACNRKISAPSTLSLPGSAPKQAPIEQHNAFHDIDRAEATKVLKTLPDGNYLFRPSSKEGNACVLSVVCRGTVYHLAVLSQEDGRLSFGSDEGFEDLRAIVHFYKKQALKLLHDGDSVGTVSLTKGVNARKKLK